MGSRCRVAGAGPPRRRAPKQPPAGRPTRAGGGRCPLEGVRQNTWQAGLDRVLVGAAMDEEDLRTVGLALPIDDVDSTDVDLAGRLAELVDRLDRKSTRLNSSHTIISY